KAPPLWGGVWGGAFLGRGARIRSTFSYAGRLPALLMVLAVGPVDVGLAAQGQGPHQRSGVGVAAGLRVGEHERLVVRGEAIGDRLGAAVAGGEGRLPGVVPV